MNLFIIYFNISVCFGHANMKKINYYTEPKTWAIIYGKLCIGHYPTAQFHLKCGSTT